MEQEQYNNLIKLVENTTPESYQEFCISQFRKSKANDELDAFYKQLNLSADKLDLAYVALGMPIEAGEISSIIQKYVYFDKPIDIIELILECGDHMWYQNAMLALQKLNMQLVMECNMIKLAIRYPGGKVGDYQPNKELERQVIGKFLKEKYGIESNEQ